MKMAAKVDTLHPDYRKAVPRWKLVRDIINNDAQDRIFCPSTSDEERNKQYKESAVLTNFTNFTLMGLTGLVFRKLPKVSLPKELEYLEEDCTGTGINLVQFAEKSFQELLKVGRGGFLVDYYAEAGKAFIKPYIAESIRNWKTRIVDGKCVLSLVVLEESILVDESDLFSQETEVQYRALWLNPDNIYEQIIYNKDLEPINKVTPLNYNRQPFKRIPFKFVGSQNNDWELDWLPLYDIAVINLAHYRNSADEEESSFVCGQPFPIINIGYMSHDEFKEANPGGVEYGSRAGLVVNADGGADLLQANANQLVSQIMQNKMEQAAAIGARLIEKASGTRETAEGAKIRYGSQHASLYSLTLNESWAIEDTIKLVCEFMNGSPDAVEFKLNDEFYEQGADANLIAQQIMLLDRGVISKAEIREYGRMTGFIKTERTDEDIEADVDLTDPLLGINIERQDNKTSNSIDASNTDTSE